MQHTSIALDLNLFQEKQKKVYRQQKYHNKYFRIEAYNLMCGYFCTVFIDFMLKGKSLLNYTNLFSPNEYEMNDKY